LNYPARDFCCAQGFRMAYPTFVQKIQPLFTSVNRGLLNFVTHAAYFIARA